jgi:hypothetical protein
MTSHQQIPYFLNITSFTYCGWCIEVEVTAGERRYFIDFLQNFFSFASIAEG